MDSFKQYLSSGSLRVRLLLSTFLLPALWDIWPEDAPEAPGTCPTEPLTPSRAHGSKCSVCWSDVWLSSHLLALTPRSLITENSLEFILHFPPSQSSDSWTCCTLHPKSGWHFTMGLIYYTKGGGGGHPAFLLLHVPAISPVTLTRISSHPGYLSSQSHAAAEGAPIPAQGSWRIKN